MTDKKHLRVLPGGKRGAEQRNGRYVPGGGPPTDEEILRALINLLDLAKEMIVDKGGLLGNAETLIHCIDYLKDELPEVLG